MSGGMPQFNPSLSNALIRAATNQLLANLSAQHQQQQQQHQQQQQQLSNIGAGCLSPFQINQILTNNPSMMGFMSPTIPTTSPAASVPGNATTLLNGATLLSSGTQQQQQQPLDLTSPSQQLTISSNSSSPQQQQQQPPLMMASQNITMKQEQYPNPSPSITPASCDTGGTTETNCSSNKSESLLAAATMMQSLHSQNSLQSPQNCSGEDENFQIGSKFYSFAEFEKAFEEWKLRHFHPFRVASSETLRMPDGSANEVFKYRYIVYHCAHYGAPRMRGAGKRPNQNYLPCGCRAMLRLNFGWTDNSLRITTLNTNHTGHEVNEQNFHKFAAKIRRPLSLGSNNVITALQQPTVLGSSSNSSQNRITTKPLGEQQQQQQQQTVGGGGKTSNRSKRRSAPIVQVPSAPSLPLPPFKIEQEENDYGGNNCGDENRAPPQAIIATKNNAAITNNHQGRSLCLPTTKKIDENMLVMTADNNPPTPKSRKLSSLFSNSSSPSHSAAAVKNSTTSKKKPYKEETTMTSVLHQESMAGADSRTDEERFEQMHRIIQQITDKMMSCEGVHFDIKLNQLQNVLKTWQ